MLRWPGAVHHQLQVAFHTRLSVTRYFEEQTFLVTELTVKGNLGNLCLARDAFNTRSLVTALHEYTQRSMKHGFAELTRLLKRRPSGLSLTRLATGVLCKFNRRY